MGLAAAALFVVAILEWQTWHRPASTPQNETATVAQVAPPSAPHPPSQPLPTAVSATVRPVKAPPVPEPLATEQSTPAASSTAGATLHEPSPPASVESAESQTPEQNELDSDSGKVKMLRAEMQRGDADAPVNLANMYLEGKDVSRSCDAALNLLESAAAKNNVRARNRLAALYEIGTCVQRDRVQAYRWLSSALAADRNNSWAQQNLDQTWREMTSEERTLAEASR